MLAAQRLKGHRERDQLSKIIVQPNEGTTKPTGLKIRSQPDTALRKPLYAFQIIGFSALRGLQREAESVTKRVRVASAAATALKNNLGGQPTRKNDVIAPARRLETKVDGLRQLANGDRISRFTGRPPFRADGETIDVTLFAELIHLDLEIGHLEDSLNIGRRGARREDRINLLKNKNLANDYARAGEIAQAAPSRQA
jgi:hypothetical protein